jgi:hypothetical protein
MIDKIMMNPVLRVSRNIYNGESIAYLGLSLPQLDEKDPVYSAFLQNWLWQDVSLR